MQIDKFLFRNTYFFNILRQPRCITFWISCENNVSLRKFRTWLKNEISHERADLSF